MKKQILAAAAAVAVTLGGSASAATYISYFDYSNTGSGGAIVKRAGVASDSNAWAKATIVEGVNSLNITIDLFDVVGFVNTGSGQNNNAPGNKQPFAFNADAAYTVGSFNNTTATNPDRTFYYGGHKQPPAQGWEQTPFGYFTDFIGCCSSPTNIVNGSGARSPGPLVFTISGITGGSPISHIFSTPVVASGQGAPGGWWFTADVTDANGGTFTIAARDIRVLAVPEPTTWALMIMGFGGAGAMLRRRKAALA